MIVNKAPSKTKVVVAMSGGVDSSVVAAMMVEQGYQVVGVTMQLYDHGLTVGKKGACCAGQDIYDAKTVADQLNIPHYVLNYENLFKQAVIDDFVDSYSRGETPIPCIRCNQNVKFKDLLFMAKSLEADFLCTGHYVRKVQEINGFSMLRGKDHKKDQSYFLFTTTKTQLSFVDFPLGHLSKEETRQIATKHNLIVADKPDSQDICFVPDGNYADIVSKYRPGALDKGPVVDLSGRVIAEHNGIINFTIGQRKGLGISSDIPLYVIKIIPETKTVIVGPLEALKKTRFIIKDVNWLGSYKYQQINAMVRIRSSHDLVPASLKFLNNQTLEVTLKYPEKAVTPGQACVIYSDEKLLGGGWITREIF